MTLLLIDYYYKTILVSIFIEIFFSTFCCCVLHHLYFITAHNLILICFTFSHKYFFCFRFAFISTLTHIFQIQVTTSHEREPEPEYVKGGRAGNMQIDFYSIFFFIIISLLVVYTFSQTLLLWKVLGEGHKNQHPLFIIVVFRFWDLFYDCCQKCFIGALVLHDFIFILFSTFFYIHTKGKPLNTLNVVDIYIQGIH